MTTFWLAAGGTLVVLCATGAAFLITYLAIVALCGVIDRRLERRRFISDYERRKYSITVALPYDLKTRSPHGRR